jgi:hypothetical protein
MKCRFELSAKSENIQVLKLFGAGVDQTWLSDSPDICHPTGSDSNWVSKLLNWVQ